MTPTDINQKIASIVGLNIKTTDTGITFIKTPNKPDRHYNPAQDWADGGPLIDRYSICLIPTVTDEWTAIIGNEHGVSAAFGSHYSPLTAACLAIIQHHELISHTETTS
ncbi:phage protein NinX family protein [Endozoicomonas atrinae]|uniref:phage protein NinX family protein n=1 Tax=Endozoicomonas atrinae TaxID=1333660 RepID=UPI000826F0EB|nr:phage protein NinX family protein [Endozoicomonas atrinae]